MNRKKEKGEEEKKEAAIYGIYVGKGSRKGERERNYIIPLCRCCFRGRGDRVGGGGGKGGGRKGHRHINWKEERTGGRRGEVHQFRVSAVFLSIRDEDGA